MEKSKTEILETHEIAKRLTERKKKNKKITDNKQRSLMGDLIRWLSFWLKFVFLSSICVQALKSEMQIQNY